MALSGFYKVSFSALLPGAGGIVTAENGVIRGGDGQYLYAGTFQDGPGGLSAVVRVKAATAGAKSVFGTAGGAFTLNLSGQITPTGFRLSGSAPVPGGNPVTISGTKIAELDLS